MSEAELVEIENKLQSTSFDDILIEEDMGWLIEEVNRLRGALQKISIEPSVIARLALEEK